jgi:hypothetical protein
MSRIGTIFLAWLLLAPSLAVAQTADAALAKTRKLTEVDADGCLKARGGEDIVVCGTNPENRAQRLPYPAERDPGRPPPRGEIQAASSAPMRQGSCGALVTDRCGGGLNILAVVPFVAKLAVSAVDPEAVADPPTPVPEPR